MKKIQTVGFPATKTAFAELYEVTERTFRTWVQKLIIHNKVSFSYEDFKQRRVLPLAWRVEIAQNLGI